MGENEKKYNLEDRTLEFGRRIIRLGRFLGKDPVNYPLISQVIRSGTSVGANYREAKAQELLKICATIIINYEKRH